MTAEHTDKAPTLTVYVCDGCRAWHRQLFLLDHDEDCTTEFWHLEAAPASSECLPKGRPMTTDPTDKAPSIEDDAWLGELVKDLESVTTPCSCRVNGAAYELRVMYAEGMLLRGLLREVADYIDPRVEGYSDLRLRIKEAAHNGRYPDDASSGSPALREDDRDDR